MISYSFFRMYQGSIDYSLLSMNRSFYTGKKSSSSFLNNRAKPAVFRNILKKRNGKSLEEAVTLKAIPLKNPLRIRQKANQVKDISKFHKIKLPSNDGEKVLQPTSKIQDEQHNMMRDTVKSKASTIFPQMIPKEQLLSLEQIQERVEKIIHEKLSKIKSFRTYKHSERKEDQIDEQLQKLLKSLYLLRSADNIRDSEMNEEIDVINTRISILEKIIAQSSTEAEMMKKYFYSKRLQRKLSIKPDNPLYRSLEILKKTSDQKNFLLSNSSIYKESVAKSSFKKPNLTSYPVKKKKQIHKSLNSQPILRSSYSREFVNFGTLPRFSIKQLDNKIFNKSSFAKKSTYKNEFTTKSSKLVNLKEQDCCRDKIKYFIYKNDRDRPFFYQRKKNTELATFSKEYYDFTKIQNKKSTQKHYIKNIISQSRLNYSGKQTPKQTIKNFNLDRLKHNYKFTVHA